MNYQGLFMLLFVKFSFQIRRVVLEKWHFRIKGKLPTFFALHSKKSAVLFICSYFTIFFIISQGVQANENTINSHHQKKLQKSRTLKILKNKDWVIKIDPATMEIVGKAKNNLAFSLSTAQTNLGKIENLQFHSNGLKWEYVEKKIKVSINLEGSSLFIDIESNQADKFDFPIIKQTDHLKGLILPRREGVYADLENKRWHDYLLDKEYNTTEDLTMPFWGLDLKKYGLTYIVTNRFNNKISFKNGNGNGNGNGKLNMQLSHFFTRNSKKKIGFIIKLCPENSPVASAKTFRNYLIDHGQFVTMKEKAIKNPKVNRLLGAIHSYLHGDMRMSFDDVKRKNKWNSYWKDLCKEIVHQSLSTEPSIGKLIKKKLPKTYWKELVKLANLENSFEYIESLMAQAFSEMLSKPDFYEEKYFEDIVIPKEANNLISLNKNKITKAQLFKQNSLLFYAAFPDKIRHPNNWGYGYSLRMLHMIKSAGIDKARFVQDLWDFGMIDYRPEMAGEADKLGYLLGAYDIYIEVHNPKYNGTDQSWPSAQFDQKLFEKGGIVLSNKTSKSGYKNIGKLLNPGFAFPWVKKRVKRIMENTPYNSYFIDADAYGELYDDYSPIHPSTQEEIMNDLVERMRWIRDTFNVVIGSEGGSSYAAPIMHVAEGMMSSAFGAWKDKAFNDNKSKYYLGLHFPKHGPEVFLKQVPLKETFIFSLYDPKYRLPLNEIVFHDSFVSTCHYSSSSLKFKNIKDIVELTSLLYMTPPMYHLNIKEFNKHKAYIIKHFNFFSPIHRKIGFDQMTDFKWLDKDHLVQKTTFENFEIIANFRNVKFRYKGIVLPPKSVLSFSLVTGKHNIYVSPFQ